MIGTRSSTGPEIQAAASVVVADAETGAGCSGSAVADSVGSEVLQAGSSGTCQPAPVGCIRLPEAEGKLEVGLGSLDVRLKQQQHSGASSGAVVDGAAANRTR